MRRRRFLRLNLTLAMILISVQATLAADAKDSDAQAGNSNWFAQMFGPKENTPPKKKAAAPDKDALKKQEQAAKSAKEKQDEQAMLKREQAAYLRRLAVCAQLKEVALKNNDFALTQKAEQLEDRALAVYNKRIARLKASSAAYQADEPALDMSPSRQPSRSTSPSSRGSQATIGLIEPKEEKP
jgi:hypothetical protein